MAEYIGPLKNEFKLILVINIGGKEHALGARGSVNDLPRLAEVAACLARAGQSTIKANQKHG